MITNEIKFLIFSFSHSEYKSRTKLVNKGLTLLWLTKNVNLEELM